MMNANYEYFINGSFEEFIGDWVIIVNEKVVAHGPRGKIKAMLNKARETHPKEPLFIAKVPEKIEQILCMIS
jgi:hypothetical protein